MIDLRETAAKQQIVMLRITLERIKKIFCKGIMVVSGVRFVLRFNSPIATGREYMLQYISAFLAIC